MDAGVVTEEELETALAAGGLLGSALRKQGLIDKKTLQRALVLQLLKRTSRIFGMPPSTKWAFTPSLEIFTKMPEGVRIDSLRILWAGLSAHGEMGNWLDLTLKHVGESPFQVRKDVNLRRYGFTGDAGKVVKLVRDERRTLSQVIAEGLAPEDVVRTIVYLLAITRYLDFTPAGEEPSAPPISSSSESGVVAGVTDEASISDETTSDETSASEGPVSSGDDRSVKNPRRVARIKLRRVAVRPAAPDPPGSGEHRPPLPRSSADASVPPAEAMSSDGAPDSGPSHHDPLHAEVKSRLARLSMETPFSLLNLEPADLKGQTDDDALTDVFWEAYERCSRRWHPDKCPTEQTELREGMTKIYEAVTDAFISLTEADGRHELIRTFLAAQDKPDSERDEAAPPSSGDRPIEDLKLSPTELHAKALVALSEEKIDEARALCRRACDAEPENPDFRASSVWIRASMADPKTKELLLDLDAVLRRHPDHVQARYYRGVLRHRLGSNNAATRDFERVVELQSSHAGARAQLEKLAQLKKKTGKSSG